MKRVLLDTHVLLWWLIDSPELGPKTRELISNNRNQVMVSAATVWEIAIKRSLGKLECPPDLEGIVEDQGFEPLPISCFHAEQAGELPLLHRDPFDRMLVAQAQSEGLLLLTGDDYIPKYGIRTWHPEK